MDMSTLTRRSFLGGVAIAGTAFAMMPSIALAETSAEKQAEADAVRAQLVTLQADLEVAADNYYKALDEQEAAKAAMQAAQADIDAANEQIASLQSRLGSRVNSMYRTGSLSALDFLLGASSFQEFTNNWSLLTRMNEQDSDLVETTKTVREELQAAKDEYARQEAAARQAAEEAAAIKNETEAQIAQANELVAKLDAEAQALLEQEMAEEARKQAEKEAARNPGNGNGNGNGNDDTGSNDNWGGTPPPANGSVVDYAYYCIGTPYVWGGETPGVGMDCSGLVRWCYLQIGISLPHYTESMYACASNIVSVSQARPGDVLYRPGHVGIAAGYGGVPYVHAPTFGAYVRDTDPLSWSGFTCALQF